MRAVRPLSGAEPDVLLARPLLGRARRAETRAYCEARGVAAREDAMNDDEGFARVRLRRRVLPLLETFNPRGAEPLARAAGLLRADAEALGIEARRLLCEAEDEGAQAGSGAVGVTRGGGPPPLRVATLAAAMPAVRRRALREWLARGRGDLRRVELAHVVGVERLLAGGRGGRVAELPGGGRIERRGRWIFFRGAASAGAEEGEKGAPES